MRGVGGPLAQDEARRPLAHADEAPAGTGESIQPGLECRITAVWHARFHEFAGRTSPNPRHLAAGVVNEKSVPQSRRAGYQHHASTARARIRV